MPQAVSFSDPKADRTRIRPPPSRAWSQATAEVAGTFVLVGKEVLKQQRRHGKQLAHAGGARAVGGDGDPRVRRCEFVWGRPNGRV